MSFQLFYTSVLVTCYVVYFAKFLGSPEATKKSFPITRMKALLPNLMADKVGRTVHSEVFDGRTIANCLEVMELNGCFWGYFCSWEVWLARRRGCMKFHWRFVHSNPCQKTIMNLELFASGPRWLPRLTAALHKPLTGGGTFTVLKGVSWYRVGGRRESRAILWSCYFSFSSDRTWWCAASHRHSDLRCPLERKWAKEEVKGHNEEEGVLRKRVRGWEHNGSSGLWGLQERFEEHWKIYVTVRVRVLLVYWTAFPPLSLLLSDLSCRKLMQLLCVSAVMVIFRKGGSQPGQSDVIGLILQTFLNWKEARLTWSFFKQSFLKQILTEGEAQCVGMLGKGKRMLGTGWTRSLGRLGGGGVQRGTSRRCQPRCSYWNLMEHQKCPVLLDVSLGCCCQQCLNTRWERWRGSSLLLYF